MSDIAKDCGQPQRGARYQQVGLTVWNERNVVGKDFEKICITFPGDCVTLQQTGTHWYLASGYNVNLYRDQNCKEKIGDVRFGHDDWFFKPDNENDKYKSYKVWQAPKHW
ncbi:hypothetical protein N0V90_007554 [Kalmusia sp. IMI 367209]|nr:hypothetical protein N0V90_007554 [Kalmusia sp. IMI 367209]